MQKKTLTHMRKYRYISFPEWYIQSLMQNIENLLFIHKTNYAMEKYCKPLIKVTVLISIQFKQNIK